MGGYTVAETFMILCPTRERTCTPHKCMSCGWISEHPVCEHCQDKTRCKDCVDSSLYLREA